MKLLFKHIKNLLQIRPEGLSFVSGAQMRELPQLSDAFLLVESGQISAFGPMAECPDMAVDTIIDASSQILLPTWCDSHSHLVYAGTREGEFVDRINGLTYEEIAAKGGGILNSAKKLQATSERDLLDQSLLRLQEVMRLGTGAIEIKSGYGLTTEAELKILRVIQKLKASNAIPIKATFLGAHAVPASYKGNGAAYVDLIIEKMLPQIAEEQLADFIDVFCEKGYFSLADTEKIMAAGNRYGLPPKIHVNQFNAIGGVPAGVAHHARSVDHLEVLQQSDVDALKGSATILWPCQVAPFPWFALYAST